MTDREPPAAEGQPSAGSPSILVVEDNRPNRILIEVLLEGLGCAPSLARGGAEALEMARARQFDMVLMDIHMPRMDGLETLRRLRGSDGPNAATPVVALTANGYESDHDAFEAAGFAAIVVKPVTAATLAATIREWARPSRAVLPAA